MNKVLTIIFTVTLLTAIAGSAYADPNDKTVFVTSAKFNSNLGGLLGADEKCQAEADAPSSIVPPGTYFAWLSDGTDSPNIRFGKSSHPYMLPDGTKIAEDYTDLTDGSILHKINIDPTGKSLGRQQYWTGTNADGTTRQLFYTCYGWTGDYSPGAHGMAGSSWLNSTTWSMWRGATCGTRLRLACFQQ